ncbi:MAG: class IV adenylate cyclase [Candidatus Bathyarchaeota archaeon]
MKIAAHQGLSHKMVELKAHIDDLEVVRKKLTTLGAKYIGTLHQKDQYFEVPEGRLKLREVEENNTLELIYYQREDIAGPKKDDAFILKVQEAEEFKEILEKILTPLILVKKVREIYHLQGTQIHLDIVEGLGKFVEFERQISDTDKTENGRKILENLMDQLQISSGNLESLSYCDLVEN